MLKCGGEEREEEIADTVLLIGPVVAGIIGKSRLAYDIWGETVNKASRMESTGLPGTIQISEETFEILRNYPVYHLEHRGKVKVHGLGSLHTWLVSRNINLSAQKENSVKFQNKDTVISSPSDKHLVQQQPTRISTHNPTYHKEQRQLSAHHSSSFLSSRSVSSNGSPNGNAGVPVKLPLLGKAT